MVIIATGKVDPIIILIFIIIGYIIPDFYLKRRVARRKYLIARRLPETVDLLGLCIEAGLDFVNAVRWVIDRTPHTPMTEELAFVVEEIKWGKPRVQALKDMSRRLDISEITSFVQTIIQAERMGTPVAEAFAMLSEDARAQRFHRGERTALQAPIKILLPLIFFIMPVIGIIVGGPILLTFMQGGFSGFK
jgi:tight adherence protein C